MKHVSSLQVLNPEAAMNKIQLCAGVIQNSVHKSDDNTQRD